MLQSTYAERLSVNEEFRETVFKLLGDLSKDVPNVCRPDYQPEYPEGFGDWSQDNKERFFNDKARQIYLACCVFNDQLVKEALENMRPILEQAYRQGLKDGEENRDRLREYIA